MNKQCSKDEAQSSNSHLKKMFSIINHQRNTNKNYNEVCSKCIIKSVSSSYSVRITKIRLRQYVQKAGKVLLAILLINSSKSPKCCTHIDPGNECSTFHEDRSNKQVSSVRFIPRYFSIFLLFWKVPHWWVLVQCWSYLHTLVLLISVHLFCALPLYQTLA